MYFASKKDRWLYPIHWGCMIACFTPLFIGRDFEALFFTVPFALLLIWCWFFTGYTVENGLLIIRNGPIRKTIPIEDIKKISPTKNLLAASALSIDRLEIIYESGVGMALISPKDQQKFTALLTHINPHLVTGKTT